MRDKGRIELEQGYVIPTCTMRATRIHIREYEVSDGGEESFLSCLWKPSCMCTGSSLVGLNVRLSSSIIDRRVCDGRDLWIHVVP